MDEYKYLNAIDSPEDLKKLPLDALPQVADEIRDLIIKTVSKNGGHLASNLGAVELTIGLHRVFSAPQDHIMFDVGHQCYAHKIITGRRKKFESLRTLDGITGFLNPCESEYDCFVSGHASNSVSVALGMARADTVAGKKASSVCVIGDGALTGGIAYEALNDAGRSALPIIVVLNDNDMSISRNVGGIAKWLSKIRLQPKYFVLKSKAQKLLDKLGRPGKRLSTRISAIKRKLKSKLLPENIFSVLGFHYLGPANGNDIEQVITLLTEARRLKRPVVVHFKTQKGKGYAYSEENPAEYHGVSAFDPASGNTLNISSSSFSSVFGEELKELAQNDPSICAITAAMELGTGLSPFRKAFPDRFFDVGIAEGHAVSMAAAMAANGAKPVFAVYSSFLQRAYDQLIHDTSLGNNHVVFAIDRTGPVGQDGASHHGLFDLPFLRSVPNMAIFAPSSFAELREALKIALYHHNNPVAVKYPRGAELIFNGNTFSKDSAVLREGNDITLVGYGIMINNLLRAAECLEKEGISAEIIKLNRLDIPDFSEICASAQKTGNVLICEDCVSSGCIGELISSYFAEKRINANIRLLNMKNSFGEAGTVDEIYARHGLNYEQIAASAEKIIKKETLL